MIKGAREVVHRYLRQVKPTLFDSGIGARLPPEYRKFYDEWRNTEPEPVHYKKKEGSKWKMDEKRGVLKWHEDVPILGKYPKEFNNVFSGGEMVVQGFLPPKARRKPLSFYYIRPRFWVPVVYRSVIYSEILNKHMNALMTKRAVDLIHKHKGLDFYLLQTKACDLKTLIALRLKRKLLLTLRDKELPYDEETNLKIYEKYKPFLLPPEEVEWYGLSFTEACIKLKNLEEKQKEESIVPLKHIFRAQLIESLKQGEVSKPEEVKKVTENKPSWFSKISNIGSKKEGT